MPLSAQKILDLADQFEKQAVDIKQPASFDEDYKRYMEMLNPTPKDDEGAYEKWLKDNSTFEDTEEPTVEGDEKVLVNPVDVALPTSLDADTYIRTANQFANLSQDVLLAVAKEKLDPKAKVRNRGTVCVPASSAKDKKDHFPINNEAQARNALARVHQYSSAPEWYSGSLKGLQDLVSRKVHSKYPSIGKEKKSKKSSLISILSKYGQ